MPLGGSVPIDHVVPDMVAAAPTVPTPSVAVSCPTATQLVVLTQVTPASPMSPLGVVWLVQVVPPVVVTMMAAPDTCPPTASQSDAEPHEMP